MITKEIINGEEVFAIEHLKETFACSSCMFISRSSGECLKIKCTSSERGGAAGVYFLPTHDLKTLAAYHAQEAAE